MTEHPIGHTLAISSVVATLAGWLPPLVALLGAAWYCVLFYDRFFGKGRVPRD